MEPDKHSSWSASINPGPSQKISTRVTNSPLDSHPKPTLTVHDSHIPSRVQFHPFVIDFQCFIVSHKNWISKKRNYLQFIGKNTRKLWICHSTEWASNTSRPRRANKRKWDWRGRNEINRKNSIKQETIFPATFFQLFLFLILVSKHSKNWDSSMAQFRPSTVLPSITNRHRKSHVSSIVQHCCKEGRNWKWNCNFLSFLRIHHVCIRWSSSKHMSRDNEMLLKKYFYNCRTTEMQVGECKCVRRNERRI